MKWFGRKGGRPNAHPLLYAGWAGAAGSGVWPRSYEAQVREAYLQNPIAQRSVRLVAEGVGGSVVYAASDHDRAAELIGAAGAGNRQPASVVAWKRLRADIARRRRHAG